jgi:hypothetical protein
VNVLPKPGGGIKYDLALDKGPESIKDQREIRLKVNNPSPDELTLGP